MPQAQAQADPPPQVDDWSWWVSQSAFHVYVTALNVSAYASAIERM